MKHIVLLILIGISFQSFSQRRKYAKEPIEFTHQPILLLKFNPVEALANNNTFQFGAEIAPPFGKFSFAFDYGTGKGKLNKSKFVRENLPETETEVFKGELKMYFSDWYPFYALDKKPFGRYYSIEYVDRNISRSESYYISQATNQLPDFASLTKVNTKEKQQEINLKVGKHFLISKLFFIDVFAGLGLGRYENQFTEPELLGDGISILSPVYINSKDYHPVGESDFYMSKTAGVKLILAL